MRESCSCGAAIHTLFYRRALAWRETHLHGDQLITDLTSDLELGGDFPIGFSIPAEEEN